MRVDGTDYKLLFDTKSDIVFTDDVDGEVLFHVSEIPRIVECLLEMVRYLPESEAKESILREVTDRLSPAPTHKEARRQRRIWREQGRVVD